MKILNLSLILAVSLVCLKTSAMEELGQDFFSVIGDNDPSQPVNDASVSSDFSKERDEEYSDLDPEQSERPSGKKKKEFLMTTDESLAPLGEMIHYFYSKIKDAVWKTEAPRSVNISDDFVTIEEKEIDESVVKQSDSRPNDVNQAENVQTDNENPAGRKAAGVFTSNELRDITSARVSAEEGSSSSDASGSLTRSFVFVDNAASGDITALNTRSFTIVDNNSQPTPAPASDNVATSTPISTPVDNAPSSNSSVSNSTSTSGSDFVEINYNLENDFYMFESNGLKDIPEGGLGYVPAKKETWGQWIKKPFKNAGDYFAKKTVSEAYDQAESRYKKYVLGAAGVLVLGYIIYKLGNLEGKTQANNRQNNRN